MDKNFAEINANIEESSSILQAAWKNHTPQISTKMEVMGKPVGERYLRKQWEEPKDVKRTNILKRFKQFWGGSYLTRIRSGEIIFADLSYFRSLFLPKDLQITDISLQQSFFRINDLWFQAQQAFFARDFSRFDGLMLPLTQEIFNLRRMLAIKERVNNHESLLQSIFKRIFRKFGAK